MTYNTNTITTTEITGIVNSITVRKSDYSSRGYVTMSIIVDGKRMNGNATKALVAELYETGGWRNPLDKALGRTIRFVATIDDNRFVRPRNMEFVG